MKLELSLTWNTARPAWRVQSKMFHWGPWCYTRRNAWWEWLKGFDRKRNHCSKDEFGIRWVMFLLPVVLALVLWEKATIPFKRVWRWFGHRCVVCGRDCKSVIPACHYRYCSIECSAYDGALIGTPMKSWILFGTLKEPKRHFEADMKCDE